MCVVTVFFLLLGVQSVYATTYANGDVLYIDLSDSAQRDLLVPGGSLEKIKRLGFVGDGVVAGNVEVKVNNVSVVGFVNSASNPDWFKFDFEDPDGFGRALVDTDVLQIRFYDVSNIEDVIFSYTKPSGAGDTVSLSQAAYDFFLPPHQLVQIPVEGLNGIMSQVGGMVSTVLPMCLGVLAVLLVVQLIFWFRRLFL